MSGRLKLPALARWLHTYVSLAAFTALFLFSVTGLTLNHASWFERAEPRVREARGELPVGLRAAAGGAAPTAADVDGDAIVAWLRGALGVHGELHELTVEDGVCFVILYGPAYTCDATVRLATGEVEVVEERRGAVAWLDDLHKGRHTGPLWSLVVDLSAVVSALTALTGVWLLLYVRRRRRPGLVTAAIGGLGLALVAWLGLP